MNLRFGALELNTGLMSWITNFEPGTGSGETVTLRADLNLKGSKEDIQFYLEAFSYEIEQARAAQNDRAIAKVYIEADAGNGWLRSEILDGIIDVDSNTYDRYQRNDVPVSLVLTRRNYWEGEEAQIQLENPNTVGEVTTVVKVYNCNDGNGTRPNKRVNYVDIRGGGDRIKGDVPTPAKFVIGNGYANPLGGIWIGMNNTRTAFGNWTLEAEGGIGITPVTQAGTSGGSIAKGTMAYGSEAAILRWELSSALMSGLRGQKVRMLMRANYLGSYQQFRYKIKLVSGVRTLYETDWVREPDNYARHWLDMFELRLPPWLEGVSDLAPVELQLWATPIVAGTWTWAFDDIQLFATDGFFQADFRLETEGILVIDGIEKHVWVGEQDTTDKFGAYKAVGDFPMLIPRNVHRFYFALHRDIADSAPIDAFVGVRIYYRPRWRTL